MSPHTELARWAEAVVIAPATANTLAKAAHGLSDDLVSATLLATTAPGASRSGYAYRDVGKRGHQA